MKTLFNCIIAEVEVVVFDFEGFLEVGQRTSQFFSATEDASEVVICNCAVAIAFFG